MHTIDWTIVALYVLSAIGVGAWFTKRAAKSTTDFFVAGRSLPWWIAGTSIVATTFSADTPLFVAGLSRTTGIHGNWFWWSAAIGSIASVFFFAKLWRRTEALTDVEFVVKRYEPGAARSSLRMFKVFFDGVFVNCFIMASVTLAMAKIAKVILGLSEDALFTVPVFGPITPTGIVLVVLGASALLYSALSGLYGVVYTDLIQFALAMLGSIGLAVIVYVDASGAGGLMANLSASPDFKDALVWFIPNLKTFDLLTFAFFVYIFVAWWSAAPGSGYNVQRILACRTEKDSVLAFLWYNFLHYVVRSWPWIIVGLLSIVYFPGLEDAESAFPEMIDRFMPVGLKGVMVASLLAAFMSTLDTHLNWGTSYLINDFYEPFIAKNKSERHYVVASRVCMLLLTLVALLVSTRLTTIIDAYKYLGLVWAGVGTVMIARWYWWRVTPWSEIAAIVGSLVIGNIMAVVLPNVTEPVAKDYYTVRLVVTLFSVAFVWITVTLLTSRNPREQDKAFYRKMQMPGPGWAKVAAETGVEPIKGELLINTTAWLSCTILLFSLLFGIGKLLFHQWIPGVLYLTLALVSGFYLKRRMSCIRFLG
jgi:SSS family solute:Na+ symporter